MGIGCVLYDYLTRKITSLWDIFTILAYITKFIHQQNLCSLISNVKQQKSFFLVVLSNHKLVFLLSYNWGWNKLVWATFQKITAVSKKFVTVDLIKQISLPQVSL